MHLLSFQSSAESMLVRHTDQQWLTLLTQCTVNKPIRYQGLCGSSPLSLIDGDDNYNTLLRKHPVIDRKIMCSNCVPFNPPYSSYLHSSHWQDLLEKETWFNSQLKVGNTNKQALCTNSQIKAAPFFPALHYWMNRFILVCQAIVFVVTEVRPI